MKRRNATAIPNVHRSVDRTMFRRRRRNRAAFVCVGAVFLSAALALRAQAPPQFADLYPVLQTDLTNFEPTVDTNWNGVPSACQFSTVLVPATDGGEGAAATNTNYYASLTFADYTYGRSAQAQTIARALQPDYLLLQSEPITEVDNLPAGLGSQLNDPVTDTNMLAGFLNDLKNAGLRTTNLIVGAGMGTWQPSFYTYLTNFVNLPMDILDVHVYPINRTTNGPVITDYLARIPDMADAAHAVGMKVGMGECWLQKQRDRELNSWPSPQVFQSRSAYSFWSPLDREFLLCMVKLGYWKQFEFIDPFWSYFFMTNLDYYQMQPLVTNLPESQAALIVNQVELQDIYPAALDGQQTVIGQGYAEYIQSGPPALRIMSTNSPHSLALAWTPVALNFLLEQKTNLSAATWSSLPVPPRPTGCDFTAAVGATNATGFYRLRQP